MGASFGEEEFQAHVSFLETHADVGFPEPTTSPPAAYGSLEVAPDTWLGGRSYRAVVTRADPLKAEVAAAGTYYLETDYDVAGADLDPEVAVFSVGATLRVGDIVRVGSLTTPDGRVRGVYKIRLTNTGGIGAGAVSDEAGSLVTVTLLRVNPNEQNPAI